MVSIFRLAIVGVLFISLIGCLEESGEMALDEGSTVIESRNPSSPAPATDARVSHMRGLFTYMADAALFEDCASGRRYPVSMEGDYLSAERAYLESRAEPGAPLLVSFSGHLVKRPPMEGDGTIDMIVVDQFDTALPGEECEGVM